MEPLDPKKLHMTYTFKYPYPKWSELRSRDLKQIYYNTTPEVKQSIQQDVVTENELALLDKIDQQVHAMLTYPDAERIINRVMKGNREAD